MNRPSPRTHRRGFTLVELLVVIVIIGILVALLIPAIAGAIRTARNAQASAEINNLSGALAQFNNQYGDYPPSRIILSETGVYPTGSTTVLSPGIGFSATGAVDPAVVATSDITVGVLAQRSLRYLQKFFPKALLVRSGGSYFAPWDQNNDGTEDYWPDFNGNGVQDPGVIYLEGHECLVFFLGGIPQPTGPAGGSGGSVFQPGDGMVGFGKDPRYPFKYSTLIGAGGTNLMATGNRTQPMYEFQANRLVDDDGDGIPGYVDAFQNPNGRRFFAYFSSYGTDSYDPNDINLNPTDATYPEVDGLQQPLMMPFHVNYPLASQPTVSPSPNPYTSGEAVPSNATKSAQFINPKSYQILSPGADGIYGLGGRYDVSTTGQRLPSDVTTSLGFSGDARTVESDNVTNFSQGSLE